MDSVKTNPSQRQQPLGLVNVLSDISDSEGNHFLQFHSKKGCIPARMTHCCHINQAMVIKHCETLVSGEETWQGLQGRCLCSREGQKTIAICSGIQTSWQDVWLHGKLLRCNLKMPDRNYEEKQIPVPAKPGQKNIFMSHLSYNRCDVWSR